MSLDFKVIEFAIPLLLKGLIWTVGISFSSILLAVFIGIILCCAQISKNPIFSFLSKMYIVLFRGTPFMVQVFIIYYVLPTAGIYIPALWAGILALSLYSASYMAEVFRSGIESVPKGQGEAAQALGMPYYVTLRRIILPQTLGLVLPPLTSLFMSTVKNSSILSIITIQELTLTGNIIIGITFSPIEVYILSALLYWGLNVLIEVVSKRFEYKLVVNKNLR